MIPKVLGLLRDALAFSLFFAGVALEAAARRTSDAVGRFADDPEAKDPPKNPFEVPLGVQPIDLMGGSVMLSDEARQMLADGRRRTLRDMGVEQTPEGPAFVPLRGSVRSRFARGA